MTDPKPDQTGTTARPAAASSSSGSNPLPPAPNAALRYRIPDRQPNTPQSPRPNTSQSPRAPPLPRRRSSVLSYSSIEDTRRSFTNEIIDPRTGNGKHDEDDEHEVTRWHSSPLAFAILPALAGLVFQNGSAFVTDVLLLGLAAIFLNWSIRLPWDWYYSAQALRRDVEPDVDAIDPTAEALEDDVAVETASSAGGSPHLTPHNKKQPEMDAPIQDVGKREEAAAELRQQEFLALMATFIFPVLAAYLLHVIRAQLSRPSTGLVSDYNLSIFLLGAEIKPCRQVVRLVAKRTVHLQRTASGIDDPFSSTIGGKSTITNLTDRIADLEARLSEHTIVPQTVSIAQKADVSELSAELRKRYEPRVDGLERAMRRYEKRSTTIAVVMEQRLLSLETRLQEALSLAAVAAQHSQNKGVIYYALQVSSKAIAFPLKVVWNICIWPYNALEELYAKSRSLLLGPVPQKNSRKKQTRHESSGTEGKGREKGARKVVRAGQ